MKLYSFHHHGPLKSSFFLNVGRLPIRPGCAQQYPKRPGLVTTALVLPVNYLWQRLGVRSGERDRCVYPLRKAAQARGFHDGSLAAFRFSLVRRLL